MATPYQNVAKAALINWNGLSEDEAISKINNESISELESQVYAMSSMKYAVIGISKQIGLSEEETTKFFDAVINGPENAEIFNIVKAKSKDFSEEKQLGVLSTIHDGWVIDNSNEKTFNKKCDRKQLRQYAPLELIGWNEVKSDLLFLNPILKSIDVNVNEKNLEQSYHNRVANYMNQMQINNQEDLTNLVKQGKDYYPILPEELERKLKLMSHIVSEQIEQNWNEKDLETSQIFNERKKQYPIMEVLSREFALARTQISMFFILLVVSLLKQQFILSGVFFLLVLLFTLSMRKHSKKIVDLMS